MCLAVPGRVLEISGDEPLARSARIDFGGIVREISLAFVPEARSGDHVLVHAGIALCVLDPARARRLSADLDAIAALDEANDGQH